VEEESKEAYIAFEEHKSESEEESECSYDIVRVVHKA
jgi:hypothetical protein